MAIQRFNAVGGYSTGLTATAVIDALGNITGVGATFSSAIVLPINTAPALTIGNHSTKNLIMSSTDGAGLIEQGGNNAATLTVRQANGGSLMVGGGVNNTFVVIDDSLQYIQIQNTGAVYIGDSAGEVNGTYLTIDDSTTSINAVANIFNVNGRLDMNGGYSEAGATATQATNTITFNAASGNTQKFVPSAVVNTVNFTNIATTSTQCTSATLIFLHGATPYGLTTGTFSVQLAGVTKTVKWSGGSAPTLTNTANKTDILNFLTYDGGTTWLGFVGGLNF